jgi:hypothetical protein
MNGLITFIDILGYQSFLENNSATDSARKVLSLINQLPAQTRETHLKSWSSNFDSEKERQKAENFAPAFKHVIFSDTIVLILEYPAILPEGFKRDAFIFFSTVSMKLTATLFENGLPSRGVLHEGSFLIEGTCLAGRAVVESYKLCNKLDLSCLVLSKTVEEWVKVQQSGENERVMSEAIQSYLYGEYLTPLKDGTEQRLVQLNWFATMEEEVEKHASTDLIQFVMKSFWDHQKDCPSAVDSKIRNTCKLLRNLKIRNEVYQKHKESRKIKSSENSS